MQSQNPITYRTVFDCVAYSFLKSTLFVSLFYFLVWFLGSPSEMAILVLVTVLLGSLFSPIFVFPAIILAAFLFKKYLDKSILNVFHWLFGAVVVGVLYALCIKVGTSTFDGSLIKYTLLTSLITGYLCWKKLAITPENKESDLESAL